MSELYRDFIDGKADEIINALGGTITPAPANAELYRDFLDRKFDDVINAIDNLKWKTITYTGAGAYTKTVAFPVIPKIVVFEQIDPTYRMTMPIFWGYPSRVMICNTASSAGGNAPTPTTCGVSFNDVTKEITINGGNSQITAFNISLTKYAVHYI